MNEFTSNEKRSPSLCRPASSISLSGDVFEQTGSESETNKGLSQDGQSADSKVHDLRGVLDRIESVADDEAKVSFGEVLDRFGKNSFAPMLLLPGLIMVAPVVGDIPGIPVTMGLIVLLSSVQVVMKRDHFWVPRWLENRKVKSILVSKTIAWLRKPAKILDGWSKERFTFLVDQSGIFVIAGICIIIAAATPIMEVVPMTANLAGVAITAFGLAILARDGLIAMVAIASSLLIAGLVIYQLI